MTKVTFDIKKFQDYHCWRALSKYNNDKGTNLGISDFLKTEPTIETEEGYFKIIAYDNDFHESLSFGNPKDIRITHCFCRNMGYSDSSGSHTSWHFLQKL